MREKDIIPLPMSTVGRSQNSNAVKASIILLALTPMLMAIIPWDFGSGMNAYRTMMKGFHLHVTVVQIGIIFFAVRAGWSPANSIKRLPRSVKMALLLLLAQVAIVAIFAVSPAYAAIGIWKLLIAGMFAFAAAHLLSLCTSEQQVKLWFLIGSGVAGYCLLLAIVLAIRQPVGMDWVYALPALTNVRQSIFFSFTAFIGGLAGYLLAREQRHRVMAALGVGLGCVGWALAIWTGSRGGLIASLLASAILILVSHSHRKTISMYLLGTVIFGTVIGASLPVPHGDYGIGRIVGSATKLDANTISSGRVTLLKATAAKIAERSVFGWGIEQFRIAAPKEALGLKQPHNFVAQLLFSVGFFGLAMASVIMIAFIRHMAFRPDDPAYIVSLGASVGIFALASYDAGYYSAYPQMIAIVAAIGLLANAPPVPGKSGSPVPTG